MMRISIGVMLWNEEDTIGPIIDSLFQQTLINVLRNDIEGIELVVLANGCTDRSIPNAQQAIDENIKNAKLKYVTARVVELPKGRQPAWNWFVHELVGDNVKYVLFMDADILLTDPEAIMRMIDGLEHNPEKHVATGLGYKHVELVKHRSPWQSITLAMSKLEKDARFFYVTGQLYCGRANFFKKLVFPKGFICGDDAFIGYMAVTNFLTTDYEWDRILYPPHPTYVFEAYLSPFRLFRQHRRRMIGKVTRGMIFDVIKSRQVTDRLDAAAVISQLNNENKNWLLDYISKQIASRGFWVVPQSWSFYRFRQLQQLTPSKIPAKFFLACVGFIWDFFVIVAANNMFRTGVYGGAWENLPNTTALKITNLD